MLRCGQRQAGSRRSLTRSETTSLEEKRRAGHRCTEVTLKYVMLCAIACLFILKVLWQFLSGLSLFNDPSLARLDEPDQHFHIFPAIPF